MRDRPLRRPPVAPIVSPTLWALSGLLVLGAVVDHRAAEARPLDPGDAQAWALFSERRPADRPRHPDLEPPPVEVATTPAGTFLGVRDELLIEPLRHQKVRDVKFNHGGSSVSLRVSFADGSRAAFKPLQTNVQTVPRKEIAAYRINRLLGLNAVPPATARTLHKDDIFGKLVPESLPLIGRLQRETLFDQEGFTRGEVSFWIPVVADSHLDAPESVAEWTRWLSVGQDVPPGKVSLMAQLSSLLVFDLLQNNSDRFSGGNLLMSQDGRTLYYMDNTFGFQLEPQGHEKCRAALVRSQKFSRHLVSALRRLDAHAIHQAIAADPGVLTDEEIDGVVARRDVALHYIDRLIDKYGADRVLVFP